MPLKNDLSRSLAAFEQDRTLVVVLEISLSTWLVAGLVPGVVRQPAKKLDGSKYPLEPATLGPVMCREPLRACLQAV